MTKEELEKATGQDLIEQRDYCGVDGYYGDYLDDVNAEMLKRFNRLAELEAQIEKMKSDVLSLIKDRMNDDIDQNIIERLAEKWEIKEK